MGPKKDVKLSSVKRENGGNDGNENVGNGGNGGNGGKGNGGNGGKVNGGNNGKGNVGKVSTPSLNDPLNSDTWKCVVVMAVEKNVRDYYLIKELEDESASQKRPKVQVISYNLVTKIINDFIKGEIPHKYASLVAFSSVFLEAGEYLSVKKEIPLDLLAKVIKALLFHLKEDSLNRIAKVSSGPIDPIKEMAERPAVLLSSDTKRKDSLKRQEKGDPGLKVKPPSEVKQHTELVKRGEGVKESHWINDAPLDAYFDLYVLLVEFRAPEFPMELIKADIPLHGLICVDTSLDNVPNDTSLTNFKSGSRRLELKAEDIVNFWKTFLNFLWDPNILEIFKDTIFQVYTPRKMQCEKKTRKEFIYREISYLLYDMSNYKEKLLDYLDQLRMWDVGEKIFDMQGQKLVIDNIPAECMTVPVVLQYIIDAVCGNEFPIQYVAYSEFGGSYNSATETIRSKKISSSLVTRFGSHLMEPILSTEMSQRDDMHVLSIYMKTKALDAYYGLDEMTFLNEVVMASSDTTCHYQTINCGPNLQEILASSGSIFRSLRSQYSSEIEPPDVDFILYSIIMTRVTCPYQIKSSYEQSYVSNVRENSDFELIENIEMTKPYFTVTEGSRHIIKSIPYNLRELSKDFFSPDSFKIVTPAMLKACSAPDFRVTKRITVQKSFLSDMYPEYEGLATKKDLFVSLGEFVKEEVVNQINDFAYLELLTKSEILSIESEIMHKYNCIDHTYSLLLDSLFIAVHKRTDDHNTQHETFNETLKTGVGLRDFYDYILEDEADKFKTQEETSGGRTPGWKYSPLTCLQFTDSDFWVENSIKDRFWRRRTKDSERCDEYESLHSDTRPFRKESKLKSETSEKDYEFDAYNVSDSIVQFSGIKTIFYSYDCSITCELTEKLYGDQLLGVHVAQAGHTLHLYSYACPTPHIDEPFTFHMTYRNGIVLAMSRLFPLGKRSDTSSIGRLIDYPGYVRSQNLGNGEKFQYTMSLSLPNGLMVKTMTGRKHCYLRQRILDHPHEARRLFLTNGNVIKMLTDRRVQIFKIDGSFISADVNEFLDNYKKYEVIDGGGLSMVVEDGYIVSSQQLQVYQNINVNTNQTFFRRKDGSSSVLKYDGTLCVKFSDNTKICSTIHVEEPSRGYSSSEDDSSNSSDTDDDEIEDDYVIIHLVIVVEHPDYATTIYNTQTQNWSLLLPSDSEIVIEPDGSYYVRIDRETELVVQDKCIQTMRYTPEGELQFQATADLSVFQTGCSLYVAAKDSSGKTFIIHPNANCFVETDSRSEDVETALDSRFVGSVSEDLISSSDSDTMPDKGNELKLENRYFILKKDMTGYELIHETKMTEILTTLKTNDVVFTQTFPNSGLRCFVYITPEIPKTVKKWEVKSILPETKFSPHSGTITTSSTYGCPPSWMHPFPKRKSKFQIPESFSCKVYLEVKPTGLIAGSSTFDCNFCEVEPIKPKLTLVPLTKMQEYMRKLSNNDQDILREMYQLVAADVVNQPVKEKIEPSEKLKHYLQMSEYFLAMERRDKEFIRMHKIPNFFVCHPAGMSWMILNNHVDSLTLPDVQLSSLFQKSSTETEASPAVSDTFSLSEKEYNISIETCQSYSDVSYHSSRSGKTAPPFIETKGVCRCKVKPWKTSYSYPAIGFPDRKKSALMEELKKIRSRSFTQNSVPLQVESNVTTFDNETIVFPPRVCDFSDTDFDFFDGKSFEREEKRGTMSLGDLMCLGLM